MNKHTNLKPQARFIIIIAIILIAGALSWLYMRGDGLNILEPNGDQPSAPIASIEPQSPNGWDEYDLTYNDTAFVFSHPPEWELSSEYQEPNGSYGDISLHTQDYDERFIDNKNTVLSGSRVIVRVNESAGDSFTDLYERAREREDSQNSLQKLYDVEEIKINGINAINYKQEIDRSEVILIPGSDYTVEFKLFAPIEESGGNEDFTLEASHVEIFEKIVHSLHIRSGEDPAS